MSDRSYFSSGSRLALTPTHVAAGPPQGAHHIRSLGFADPTVTPLYLPTRPTCLTSLVALPSWGPHRTFVTSIGGVDLTAKVAPALDHAIITAAAFSRLPDHCREHFTPPAAGAPTWGYYGDAPTPTRVVGQLTETMVCYFAQAEQGSNGARLYTGFRDIGYELVFLILDAPAAADILLPGERIAELPVLNQLLHGAVEDVIFYSRREQPSGANPYARKGRPATPAASRRPSVAEPSSPTPPHGDGAPVIRMLRAGGALPPREEGEGAGAPPPTSGAQGSAEQPAVDDDCVLRLPLRAALRRAPRGSLSDDGDAFSVLSLASELRRIADHNGAGITEGAVILPTRLRSRSPSAGAAPNRAESQPRRKRGKSATREPAGGTPTAAADTPAPAAAATAPTGASIVAPPFTGVWELTAVDMGDATFDQQGPRPQQGSSGATPVTPDGLQPSGDGGSSADTAASGPAAAVDPPAPEPG